MRVFTATAAGIFALRAGQVAPATGDETSLLPWVMLGLGALALLALAVVMLVVMNRKKPAPGPEDPLGTEDEPVRIPANGATVEEKPTPEYTPGHPAHAPSQHEPPMIPQTPPPVSPPPPRPRPTAQNQPAPRHTPPAQPQPPRAVPVQPAPQISPPTQAVAHRQAAPRPETQPAPPTAPPKPARPQNALSGAEQPLSPDDLLGLLDKMNPGPPTNK